METPDPHEHLPKISRLRRVGRLLGRVARGVSKHMNYDDLSPHEGRLRRSGVHESHIQRMIPDYPPEFEDSPQEPDNE